MKTTVLSSLIGCLLLVGFSDGFAYSRGICHGYGGARVHVHVHAGHRYRRNDDLFILLMLSSTSTSIYCISIADEEEQRRSSGRRRYSLINYDRLKEEGARGRGEHLAALSYFFGCSADAAAHFAATVQNNYQSLFISQQEFQADRFRDRLGKMISSNPKLRSMCRTGRPETGRL